MVRDGARRPVVALVHSPLAGPVTWERVHDVLTRRGIDSIVPAVRDDAAPVYWAQHADSVARSIPDRASGVVLVAHSGAGPLLPAIAGAASVPVVAHVFVDAGLPSPGLSRLESMRHEDPEFAAWLHSHLEAGGRFPEWTSDDLSDVSDAALRARLVLELRPRGIDYFTEPLPVIAEWTDLPRAYLQLSAAYDRPAARARQLGWPSTSIDATHFHMLEDPAAVTEAVLGLFAELGLSDGDRDELKDET